MARSRKKLGEILVGAGLVSAEQLETALGMQKGAGKRIGEMLIDNGFAKEEDVAKALAKQFGLKYVDVSKEEIAEKVDLSLLPNDLIKKHLILPLGKSNGRLRLAMHDPKNLELLDMLRFRLNTEVDPYISTRGKIKAYLDSQGGGTLPSMTEPSESLITDSIDRSIDRSMDKSVDSSIDQAAESAPIIKQIGRAHV